MIAGALVKWSPSDIGQILPEDSATLIAGSLPIPGILSRIDGDIGRMAYMQQNGKKGEITVRLDELILVLGVAHVCE